MSLSKQKSEDHFNYIKSDMYKEQVATRDLTELLGHRTSRRSPQRVKERMLETFYMFFTFDIYCKELFK